MGDSRMSDYLQNEEVTSWYGLDLFTIPLRILGFNQPTVFAANLLQYRGVSRNPTTFKMELFATSANG